LKASAAWGELVKLRKALRVQGAESISVGKVAVAAGGQAIVGKIEIAHRADEPTKPKSPIKDSKEE
jgi:hypothetical protein